MTHALKIVAIIYVFLFVGSFIPINLGSLNMFNKGAADYEATDIIYSRLKQKSKFDERILIINSGVPDRAVLAKTFNKLDSLGASVIGVDIVFESEKNQQIDSFLSASILDKNNLVLADILDLKSQHSIPHSCNQKFCNKNNIGFINFVTKPNHAIRFFSPSEEFQGDQIDAFTTSIVKRFDPAAYSILQKRRKAVEQINYRGDQNSYAQINIEDFLAQRDLRNLVDGKIVLIGYMGSDDWALSARDKFYTPFNKDIGKKSLPDMFGVVIHANIISMILDQQYINDMNVWLERIINFLIILSIVLIMRKFFLSFNPGYFKGMRILQLIIFFLLFCLVIGFYHWGGLKVNLAAAIVGVILSWDFVKIYEHIIINKQKPFRKKV